MPNQTTLPDGFQFSQSSLQTWQSCRRRFQLLYLQDRAYPAPVTADQHAYEQHMDAGDLFHHMLHQHLSGVPAAIIAAHIHDDTVRGWWESYLAGGLTDVPTARHAEVMLSAPLGDYRIAAKYDLIAVEPGVRAVIVDWKTAQNRPRSAALARRMQTVVYRWLLVEAGAHYNGGQPITPEQVEMRYWFANFPTQPERIPYSAEQHAADREQLETLLAEIAAEREFPKVHEDAAETVCRFCKYRSLCWENVSAGTTAQFAQAEADAGTPDEPDFDIDLDEIEEITDWG